MDEATALRSATDAGVAHTPPVRAGLPAIRLTARPGAAVPVGGHRIGGVPDLPDGVEWPRWDQTAWLRGRIATATAQRDARDGPDREIWGRILAGYEARLRAVPPALAFIAQFDLASLPPGVPDLPVDGHLWFFYELGEQPWGYDAKHQGGWRVLYAPAGARLAPRRPPADLDEAHVLRPVALTAAPTWTPANAGYEGMTDAQLEAVVALRDTWGSSAGGPPAHQIGGHPVQLQGDMPDAIARVLRGIGHDDPDPPGFAADVASWRLLLQIDSDRALDRLWGDGGVITWWIRAEDLRARRFDDAWFKLQSG